MAGRVVGNNGSSVMLRAGEAGGGNAAGDSTARRSDGELRRMAAFRVRETANRIATLAHSAEDDGLRQQLLSICRTLLREEQALLDSADRAD